jgi:hypothetical protein
MLNVYEDEGDETDLHDFLSKEDLSTLALHISDTDERYSLIFNPKYFIRPDGNEVRKKVEEHVGIKEQDFDEKFEEDSDFFVDAWRKVNLFHKKC